MPAEKLLQSHQQDQMNRAREIMLEDPDAQLMTIVVSAPMAGQAAGNPTLDYGGLGPLDVVRAAGYMLRRSVKMMEHLPWSEVEKGIVTDRVKRAIRLLPVELGEEI